MRVIEVDVSPAAYDQGHISGAILWNLYADLRHGDYSLLDHGEFEQLLGRSGLTPQDTLVFYGYGSYLGFWLMKSYGHEHLLMLQGTRQDWRDGGMPWTAEVPRTDTSEGAGRPGHIPGAMHLHVDLLRRSDGT